MEEKRWIRIETFVKEKSKVEDIVCRLTFHDSLSVVLEDDDIDYLIDVLQKYKIFKREFKDMIVG